MTRRGFTMIEAAALVGVCGLGATVLGVVSGSGEGPRDRARLLKDSTQVRMLVMAAVTHAQSNDGRYPLPGLMDRRNQTVEAEPRSKDHTAAVYSIMLFNGMLEPEALISPFENNPNMKEDEDYQYEEPEAAADPGLALWDPAFSADFTGENIGNASYAHLQLSDGRVPIWRDTFSATEAQFSTRGPEVKSVAYEADGSARVTLSNPESRTLGWYAEGLLGKKGDAWTGNVGFADSHVEARVKMIERDKGETFKPIAFDPGRAPTLTFDEAPRERVDVLFFDEADAVRNAFLGLWTAAGDEPGDFVGAWD